MNLSRVFWEKEPSTFRLYRTCVCSTAPSSGNAGVHRVQEKAGVATPNVLRTQPLNSKNNWCHFFIMYYVPSAFWARPDLHNDLISLSRVTYGQGVIITFDRRGNRDLAQTW